MALGERLEGGEPERRLDPSAGVFAKIVLAEGCDELVDLTERLPRHLLDRLERLARSARGLVPEQPRRPGLDEDHVDRVARRVVQVAGDARALLGRGEPALALGLPLGAEGSLLELRDPLTPQAKAVADHPRPTPDQDAEEERTVGNSSSAIPVAPAWIK